MEEVEVTQIRLGGKLYNLTPASDPQPGLRVRHNRRRNHKDTFAYDKAYGMHVSNAEVTKVRGAILHTEANYTPSTANIVKQTGFPVNHVHAILHAMRTKGLVTTRRNKKGQAIYQLVEGQ